MAEEDGRFRSSRGRADLNPYVDRIAEYAPWAMTSDQAELVRGRWRRSIGVSEEAPLLVEIGPGNGFFFRELCRRRPEAAVVGIEVRFKRVWLTARKARQDGFERFRSVHHHAAHLRDLFEDGEIDAVYANHPDPWPKDRHHKHRLLQPAFRERLEAVLRVGGEVWIKSDFPDYGPLASSLFDTPAWEPIAVAADLYAESVGTLRTEPPEGARFWAADIVTNYERKSLAKGHVILLAGFRRVAPGAPSSRPGSYER